MLYAYITWYQLTYETDDGVATVPQDDNADEDPCFILESGKSTSKVQAEESIIGSQVSLGQCLEIEKEKGDEVIEADRIKGHDKKEQEEEEADDDNDDDGPKDSMRILIFKLCFAVVGIALASEVVTSTIEEMNHTGEIPTEFMIFAIVGIVGNVPEHYSALYMSWKKGDLSLAYGTAMGSSGQLMGLILPFLSIISPVPMPFVYHPKYLVMLQISWIVPLLVVYFDLHSVPMGVFMMVVYAACAAVAYVHF